MVQETRLDHRVRMFCIHKQPSQWPVTADIGSLLTVVGSMPTALTIPSPVTATASWRAFPRPESS